MIRRAALADVVRLVELGSRFLRETAYATDIPVVDPVRLDQWATQIVAGQAGLDSVVFVDTREDVIVGMIGLFIYPSPLTGEIEAIETFWWVEPEHRGRGLRLIVAAEQWARESGALTLRMIAPTPAVERLYERLGFRRIEASYVRAMP